jgi:quercetin dioxygenase-like cupin family protein
MEEKFNESTPQRPDADRLLDAPMVTVDLPAFIQKIKQEPSWKDSDRNAITVFKTTDLRLVLVALHAGAAINTHKADGVISVQVLEGRIRFNTQDSGQAEVGQGQVVVLHEMIPHSVYAEEESVFLLTVSAKAASQHPRA